MEMVEPVAVEVEKFPQAAVVLVVGAQVLVNARNMALVGGNRPRAVGSVLRLRAEERGAAQELEDLQLRVV